MTSPMSCVDWVCCSAVVLAPSPRVFLRSFLHKNEHFQIPIRPRAHEHLWNEFLESCLVLRELTWFAFLFCFNLWTDVWLSRSSPGVFKSNQKFVCDLAIIYHLLVSNWGIRFTLAGPTKPTDTNAHIAVAVVISVLIIACTALVLFYGRYEAQPGISPHCMQQLPQGW